MCGIHLISVVLTMAGAPAADRLPVDFDLETVRALTVQHDGRWPPLDTLARDLVESVTGEEYVQGKDPVLLLLAWTFEPQVWKEEPLIPIPNAELRAELQLSADKMAFSYTELTSHEHLRILADGLSRRQGGRKLDPLESKVQDINARLSRLQAVFSGRSMLFVPDPMNGVGGWKPIAPSPASSPRDAGSSEPLNAAWADLRQAFIDRKAAEFSASSSRLATALAEAPAKYRPEARLIQTELRYNRLRPYRIAWSIMAVGALLAAFSVVSRSRLLDAVAVLAMIAGFAVLSYGLFLRWTIAGRIPASNMYESLLFLSWGMGAFGIVSNLLIKDRMVPLTASIMGALSLFLADTLPLDHFVRPAAPVLLDTIWMSIHVPIIMVSYSVLALAALIAHAQLVVMAILPQRVKLSETIDSLHYWYIHVGCVLLGAGIVTGSMWAASSWGRYWGWDPKEVWSLIAFLAYLAILHLRVHRDAVPVWVYGVAALCTAGLIGILLWILSPVTPLTVAAMLAAMAAVAMFAFARGPFATASKSVLAFWMIIMTYVGVNYVLGIGLHSYGFGTGAVAHNMFMVGGIDLLFLGLCAVVYLVRNASPGHTAAATS